MADKGKLFVVGTPIGNLSDMTFRAVETLKMVDFIASEDTRVSAKLLNHFDIKKSLLSYHEHNSKPSGDGILAKILAGENCAIITDAGMPCISDPGEDLVKLCADNDVEVVVVPGASAVISALAISGLSTSRFSFEGFLSTSKRSRLEHLAGVANDTRTLIFYEAPHKLLPTLKDMLTYFGDRKISLCREITKLHEEVKRMTISMAVNFYTENNPRGEFVLVIEGAPQAVEIEQTIDEAIQKVQALVDKGMRSVDACKEIAKFCPFSKAELYSKLLDI